jgi:MFS family permease
MVAVPLMTTVLWEGTPLDGGLNLMRMLLVMPVGGILGGLLATRIGYRATAVLGLLCAGSGLLWMGAWPQTPGPLLLWGALLLAGLGFTLIDAPVIATVMDSVDEGRRAAAAAVLQVCQTLGMITGMALLATQGLGRFNHEAGRLFAGRGLEVTVEEYQAVLHRTFDETFLVAGITVLTAIVFGLLLEPGRARAVRLGRFFGL